MELRLRKILTERNLSLAQLAKESGVTPANLSNYMSGKTSPTLDTLNKIAGALKLSITELFEEREKDVKADDFSFYIEYEGKLVKVSREDLINYINSKK